ncbi:DsbE family thiol:disulfide interchange protein [Loktanella sp. IMCC34160]|uniref:DsbE family thiol:disulfide interchange protein n=1 Tax=Loktanella sp. IMCC34160 TaxID=2510646 RepID=UPI00101DEB7C|nr:DsbE family thiol:disulfide interchange protein [Loktanella sp. IMCC34160]RYG92379.1 DsbE family thiol:disulfide interchange protein [Loktanella sp. IMCC34160]
MAKVSPLVLLPPIIFAAVAGLAIGGLYWGNEEDLPSALIGQEAPAVAPEGLPGKPLLTDADLRGGDLTLVNFWASWCGPCRAEHPTLEALEAEGFRIAGINFADQQGNAMTYLAEEGDPFFAHGFDPRRRTSIDWGVTAPPETFIVDGDGTILYRFQGALVGDDYEQRFRPELEKALSGN